MSIETIQGIVTIINALGAGIALIIHAWKARDESNAHSTNAAKALDLALSDSQNRAAGVTTASQPGQA
jgi:hypothetical protein